ncbi:hypothetical protein LAZ67_4001132 [Cordylochernes scorpioides]|uniref:Transposase n=1 Tax=Cordylochernes scorpioides TaxID=51811 RepID=A0ABY6KES0_9ARAC|nr:hypothetical protein LAZ67_4001132 [Cordylochernes scorpioides]
MLLTQLSILYGIFTREHTAHQTSHTTHTQHTTHTHTNLNHRLVPTSQLLDLPIIGGCRFLRPPDLLAPARWVGARVRDLGSLHIARPTQTNFLRILRQHHHEQTFKYRVCISRMKSEIVEMVRSRYVLTSRKIRELFEKNPEIPLKPVKLHHDNVRPHTSFQTSETIGQMGW